MPKDTVITKGLSPPSRDEFDTLIEEARRQARKAGLKPSDIEAIADEVRSRKSREFVDTQIDSSGDF